MQNSDKKSRLLHLDFMRGIFLCVIIVDHLQKFPGFFELFTGRGLLWASAAEGFFFLSGILLGLIRGRRSASQPMLSVVKKLWGRATLLYIWNVLLTLLFTLIAFIFIDKVGLKPGYSTSTSVSLIVQETLSLRYVYGWADFLQYYAIFLFFSPAAIWLLRKKYWWLALIISIGVWGLWGTRSHNFYLSWQLLFFSGAVFGFYVEQIHTWFKGLQKITQKRVRNVIIVMAGLTFIVSYIFVIGSIYIKDYPNWGWLSILPTQKILDLNTWLSPGFDKPGLGVGRLITFYIWFFAMYFVIKRFAWLYEKTKVGRAITVLGQNSLYVYIVHSILLFTIGLLWPGKYGIIINAFINVGVIGLIFVLVRKRVFFDYIPR
jgi:hypothetical protein